MNRKIAASFAALLSLAVAAPGMAALRTSDYAADALWFQAGAAPDSKMVVVGATWHSTWRYYSSLGVLTTYLETSVGRWKNEVVRGTDEKPDTTQVGITPVVRLFPSGGPQSWFVEAGVGGNLLMPLYKTRARQFSTVFNFGDHLGVGRLLGERRNREVALRIQHFSNASIQKPNPGQNFVQLRYTWSMISP
jgi:lipid A 3-O-deacylase